MMRIEVACAHPAEQHLIELDVAPGTTAAEAVDRSGLAACCTDVDPDRTALAIFGRACDRDTVLRPGDRVEILRPLATDPKEARRRRAVRGG